mmetsp:Transcript_6475/g.19305  ORF Transcript_6475/g.19305 Transcript_6475/m.19305 type:complete len:329 (-) Transcript_6475:950-1936(-)
MNNVQLSSYTSCSERKLLFLLNVTNASFTSSKSSNKIPGAKVTTCETDPLLNTSLHFAILTINSFVSTSNNLGSLCMNKGTSKKGNTLSSANNFASNLSGVRYIDSLELFVKICRHRLEPPHKFQNRATISPILVDVPFKLPCTAYFAFPPSVLPSLDAVVTSSSLLLATFCIVCDNFVNASLAFFSTSFFCFLYFLVLFIFIRSISSSVNTNISGVVFTTSITSRSSKETNKTKIHPSFLASMVSTSGQFKTSSVVPSSPNSGTSSGSSIRNCPSRKFTSLNRASLSSNSPHLAFEFHPISIVLKRATSPIADFTRRPTTPPPLRGG